MIALFLLALSLVWQPPPAAPTGLRIVRQGGQVPIISGVPKPIGVSTGTTGMAGTGIPDLCATPTVTAVRNGAWSDAGTWNTGAAPAAGAVVRIPTGIYVGYDVNSTTAYQCVGIKGLLWFARTGTLTLRTSELLVYGEGELNVGDPSAPVTGPVVIEFAGTINIGTDSEQHGVGFLVLGVLRMHGRPLATTWTRLTAELAASTSTITVAACAGWVIGDRLLIPDTRELNATVGGDPYVPEVFTISALSGSSPCTVTLGSPSAIKHPSARDGTGAYERHAPVGHLTRSITVRSVNPGGVRGHWMLTGAANSDVRYVQIQDMGRTTIAPLEPTTNHIGRYAYHLHMLTGASTLTEGVVIERALRWAYTIHLTNNHVLRRNIAYDAFGWGFGNESSSDQLNVLEDNLAVLIRSDAVYRGDERAGVSEWGIEGSGFWPRGLKNFLRRNVAANCLVAGFSFWVLNGNSPASNTEAFRPTGFEGNEAIANDQGIALWYSGLASTVSTIGPFYEWHSRSYGFGQYWYHNINIVFNDYYSRGDYTQPYGTSGFSTVGIWFGDYPQESNLFVRPNIQNKRDAFRLPYGVAPPPGGDALPGTDRTTTLTNAVFNNNYRDVMLVPSPYSYGSAGQPDLRSNIINPTHGTVQAGGSEYYKNAGTIHGAGAVVNIRTALDLFVYCYEGNCADNFEVFGDDQDPGDAMLATGGSTTGCPTAALTNQQCWDTHGYTTGKKLTPATATTRAGVNGKVNVLPLLSGITAMHRAGQTFLTFTEVAGCEPYSVYRSTAPITTVSGLTAVASLDAYSGTNRYTGTGLVITDLGAPLASSTGLLVWTTVNSGTAYYAVTSTCDPTTITPGGNSTSGVAEVRAPVPGAVLISSTPNYSSTQRTRNQYYAWENYTGWRTSSWGPYWHRFDVYLPETGSAPFNLLVRLHAAGTCTWTEDGYNSAMGDGVILIPWDLCTTGQSGGDPYVSGGYFHSKWFGRFDATDDVYRNVTEVRVARYVQWVRDQAAFSVDRQRIYLYGASLGSGVMRMAAHIDGVFAAAEASIGWIDDAAWQPLANASTKKVNSSIGPLTDAYLNMATEAGLGALPPILHTFNKDDATISPINYPAALTAFETSRQPYAAQWQNGNHTEYRMVTAYPQWTMFRFKLNEPYPAFGLASNSVAVSTSPAGARNEDLDWHSALHSITGGSAITDTISTLAISLISLSGSATADVTIRNAQSFVPQAGAAIAWSNSGGGSGTVKANADGSVTIPTLTIPTTATRLTLTK